MADLYNEDHKVFETVILYVISVVWKFVTAMKLLK